MKGMFKKALAGVAAAALAVTGFAAATSTANADTPTGQTITIQSGGTNDGVVQGHSFKYVQIATYPNDDEAELLTVSNPIIKSAVKTAVESATEDTVSPANMDPLVWAQGRDNALLDDSSAFPWSSTSTSRKFADKLVELLDTEDHNGLWTPAGTADGDSLKIEGLAGGLYLIVDTTADAQNVSKTLPMLVGTANDAFEVDGTIVVKNQKTNIPPTKEVEGDTNGSVTVGDTLDFTITGKVPSTTGADDDYTYVFKDYASANLSIDTHKTNIKVYVGDSETPLGADEYSVSPEDQTVVGKGAYANAQSEPTFTVTLTKTALDKLRDQAGQKLVVKYSATVTSADTVTNDATIDNDGTASSEGSSDEVYSTPVSFTKVGSDDQPLANVTFTIAPKENTDTPPLPDSYAKTQTSGANGVVSFAGLADGTYVITEVSNGNDGYMDTGLKFEIKVDHNANPKVTVVSESSDWLNASLGLVSTDGNGKITVKNVKSVTELPQTGAAGIAMFVVLGLLIAGAGVTVWMKSRGVRNAING